ncbi:MAG: DUF4446 family protein [Actinobacteria bacterium]|nr:DUF4446 family protein [Actinomycetota bacterium]
MVSGALDIALLVVVAAIATTSLVVAVAAVAVQRRIRRTLRVGTGASGNELLVALRDHDDDLDALDAAVVDLRARLTTVERDLDLCTSRVAMVHYDAFPDMGGKLSFSVAMLDEQGDGIVLSVINGRSETRAWGKRVVAGASRQRLSSEEADVLQRALVLDRRRADMTPAGDSHDLK